MDKVFDLPMHWDRHMFLEQFLPFKIFPKHIHKDKQIQPSHIFLHYDSRFLFCDVLTLWIHPTDNFALQYAKNKTQVTNKNILLSEIKI